VNDQDYRICLRTTLPFILALSVTLSGLVSVSAVRADQTQDKNWNLCKSEDTQLSIEGCSALIQPSGQTGVNLAKAFYNRGSAYGRKGEYEHAIQDYDQALLLNPGFANAFYGRGWAYEHIGDFDRAIQDFNQALLVNPSLVIALRERGVAYAYKSDYDRAIQDYTRALQFNRDDAIGFYNRGLAYAHEGDYGHAIEDYTQAIRLNYRLADALQNRRRAYAHRGEYLRAMADGIHLQWLKFGILGITIRLFLIVLSIWLTKAISHQFRDASPDVAKSFPSKGALVLGAGLSFLALTWLVGLDRRAADPFMLGIIVASGAAMILWSMIIGILSRTRMWSPQWTFLVGAVPFYALAIWIFFFSRLEMSMLGATRELLMVCFGSTSGVLARRRVYPQFSDKDSPSTPLPPPTLFPK
jgi:tetratricopeptide (TPR) repeat protein